MDFLNNFLDGHFQNVSDWSLDGGDFYIATEPINSLLLTIGAVSGIVAILFAWIIPMKANAGKFGDISRRRLWLVAILAINSWMVHFVYIVSILASSIFYNVDDYAKESIASECGMFYLFGNLLPIVLFIGLAFLLKKWPGDHRLFSVLRSNNKILGIF